MIKAKDFSSGKILFNDTRSYAFSKLFQKFSAEKKTNIINKTAHFNVTLLIFRLPLFCLK